MYVPNIVLHVHTAADGEGGRGRQNLRGKERFLLLSHLGENPVRLSLAVIKQVYNIQFRLHQFIFSVENINRVKNVENFTLTIPSSSLLKIC